MEDIQMIGILMMIFAGTFIIFAGITAIDPAFLRVVLARTQWDYDRDSSKEHARIWAKGMFIIALGPGIGGAAMYFLGEAGLGGLGLVIFLVIFIFFLAEGMKYISRKKEERDKELGEMMGSKLICAYCGAEFEAGAERCPYCNAVTLNAQTLNSGQQKAGGKYTITRSMVRAAHIAIERNTQWSYWDYSVKPIWEDAKYILKSAEKEDKRLSRTDEGQTRYIVSPDGAIGYLGETGVSEFDNGGDTDWIWYTPEKVINELPIWQSQMDMEEDIY